MVQILKYHEAKCLIYKGFIVTEVTEGDSLNVVQEGGYRVMLA